MTPNDQVNRRAAADGRRIEDPYRRVRLNAMLGVGFGIWPSLCFKDLDQFPSVASHRPLWTGAID